MTTRKSYGGAAVRTTISSGAFNVGATTLSLTLATGWPATTNGPFVAVIDRNSATEEQILVGARSGLACSSITRGYSGTAEVGHAANAPIEHAYDAISADEANRVSSLLTAKGDSFGHDGTQLQREPVGTSGYYYTATPAASTGKSWTAPPASLVTAKGQMLAAAASGILAPTNTPANGQVLTGDSTQTAGARFADLPTPRYTICTSSTRPASPVAGTAIFETDTFRELIYTTATTGWQPPWNVAWGLISGGSDATPRLSSVNSGAGLVVYPTLSFTPLSGRNYKVTYHAAQVSLASAGSDIIVLLTDQAGTTIQNLAVSHMTAAGDTTEMSAFIYGTFATGSVTGLQVRAVCTGATASTFQWQSYAAYLIVEDIGPSGSPA